MQSTENILLNKLLNHYCLSEIECYELLDNVIRGDYHKLSLATIICLLSFKGESADELLGFTKALSLGMKKFNTSNSNLMDIVGTGGDKKNTFNISTISALVLSCLDVSVAKEIKPCVSSKCGSSDLLKALNININASFEAKKKSLDDENFVFINIPDYYPNISPLYEIEEQLGVVTSVSMLAPLCHPAMVKKIIIGTNDRQKASLIFDVISKTETEKAYILWNEEGYDELVPIGVTKILVYEKDKAKRENSLTANDFALSGNYKPDTIIPGGTIKDNLRVLEEIKNNIAGVSLDAVIMNAVLGLRLCNKVNTLKDGTGMVKEVIKNGLLSKKIEKLSNISNTVF